MKDELISIANMLLKIASNNEKDVIRQYIQSISKNKLDTARILSDEIMDHYMEIQNLKSSIIAGDLYDKTMEYYELNSN